MKTGSSTLLGQMKQTDALLVRYFSRYTRQAALAEDMSRRVMELCLEDFTVSASFPSKAIRHVARAMLIQQMETAKGSGEIQA